MESVWLSKKRLNMLSAWPNNADLRGPIVDTRIDSAIMEKTVLDLIDFAYLIHLWYKYIHTYTKKIKN